MKIQLYVLTIHTKGPTSQFWNAETFAKIREFQVNCNKENKNTEDDWRIRFSTAGCTLTKLLRPMERLWNEGKIGFLVFSSFRRLCLRHCVKMCRFLFSNRTEEADKLHRKLSSRLRDEAPADFPGDTQLCEPHREWRICLCQTALSQTFQKASLAQPSL